MFKINCKGKRTVGKANKGINVEKNNNRFKKIFQEKNSTELQKSNVEAEVYNNNQNVTERKKKPSKA